MTGRGWAIVGEHGPELDWPDRGDPAPAPVPGPEPRGDRPGDSDTDQEPIGPQQPLSAGTP